MKNKYSWAFALLLWPILCHAQLHFPTLLINELDATPIDDSTRNLIVLIHGWNPDGNTNAFLQGSEWGNLVTQLKGTSLAGSGWKLAEYHWETDANTGPTFAVLDPAVGYGNATVAAVRAQQHGDNLAGLLQAQAPNLRRVHFIAHSAGAWAARTAAINLLVHNPYCIVQMTLLDPFIPDEHFGMNVGLSTAVMSDTALLLNSDRIYRLENYYADDSLSWDCAKQPGPTVSTQERFAWRTATDTNLIVDWGGPIANPPDPLHCSFLHFTYYDWHSGPIQFYGDTIQASIPLPPLPAGLGSGCPFVYGQVGWFRSLFSERNLLPQITSHPATQTVSPGDTVTLSVVASGIGPFSYQWYKNGAVILGPTSASYSFTASANPPASYVVRVGNANGYMFSDKAIVSVYASAAPTISSVSPRTLNTLPLPQTQLITIAGSGFTSSSRLTFNDGVNPPYTDRVPASWTSTQLTFNIAVGPNPATWTVKVVNGSYESLTYSFYVVSGTKELTALSISGPATINENTSGQFNATAYYSDGSASAVTPSWDMSGSVATISASGQVNASSVSANTAVTVSASYSAGGITKPASANLIIVNTGTGTTYHQQQLIINGTFASGGSSWTLTGAFQADSRFSMCRSCPGYAYLANADGSAGNNLSGVLSQTFTIPANAVEVALDYWHRTTTTETGGNIDRLNVHLRLSGGSQVGLDDIWNGNANTAYAQRSIDLIAYKGQTVTLEFSGTTSASYPTTFRVDDVSVLVTVPDPPTPVSLAISGPSSVSEGGTGQYYATMIYSDGSTQSATALSWGNNTPSLVTFTSGGLLTAGQVSQDTGVSIWTTATVAGQSYQAFKDITVVNQAATFSYLAISGPSLITENSSGQFSGTAIFNDGSAVSASPSWSINSGPGSISSSGLLTVGEVSSDSTTTVSASATIGGVMRTASQQVSVINVPPPLTLTSLSISGPSSLNDNSTAQYTATAYFNDGSSQPANPIWLENSSATSISIFGLLSAGWVTTNTPVTVSASYTIGGVTAPATKAVTIIHTDTTAPTVMISSPTNGQNFSSSAITVSGTANDPGSPSSGVSLVQVQVNGTNGTWQTASGTASWSTSVSLTSGGNTIYVRSQDGAGYYSTIESVNVTYNPPTQYTTYAFSAPVSAHTTVALSFGSGSLGGESQITFGTLNETLYYNPVAGTLRHVGSVTFDPTSVFFTIFGESFYNNDTGTAFLVINGGNASLPFDSGTLPVNTGFLLSIPVTGLCTVVHNGQTNSGYLNYSFGIPINTHIYSATSNYLHISEFTAQGAGLGGLAGTIGGVQLYYGSGGDNTYYYSWSIDTFAGVATNLPPQLTGIAMSNGVFQFVLNGPVGSNYVVQVSTDLINWSSMSTSTIPTGGSIGVTNPVSGQPKQFYRAVMP
jgi:hypothetical protein